jgi:hypothetical protein
MLGLSSCSAGNGTSKSRGSSSSLSQRGNWPFGNIANMRSWIGATSSLAGTVMTAKVRSHRTGKGGAPAIPPGNRVPLPGRVLLKEVVHRHDATPPAVSIAKPVVLGDSFRAGMDRREIRTFLAGMRMRPQRRWPSTGCPVSGCRTGNDAFRIIRSAPSGSGSLLRLDSGHGWLKPTRRPAVRGPLRAASVRIPICSTADEKSGKSFR